MAFNGAFLESFADPAGLSVYTFTISSFGSAAPDQYLLVHTHERGASIVKADAVDALDGSDVLIATGVKIVDRDNASNSSSSVWLIGPINATSGKIRVTYPSAQSRCVGDVHRLELPVGHSLQPIAIYTSTAVDALFPLGQPENAYIAASCQDTTASAGNYAWTPDAGNENYDLANELGYSGWSKKYGSGNGSHFTLTADRTAGANPIGICTVWAPQVSPYVLDNVPLPFWAYSPRRYLRSAYIGSPVCQLFEAIGSTFKDFKLNGSNVLVTDDGNEDTVSEWLTAAGASEAQVHIWYDQTGNTRHGTYPAVGTRPLLHQTIVNGKPALSYLVSGVGGGRHIHTPSVTVSAALGHDVFALVHLTGTGGGSILTSFAASLGAFAISASGGIKTMITLLDRSPAVNTLGGVVAADVSKVLTYRHNGTAGVPDGIQHRIDGVEVHSATVDGIDFRTGVMGIGTDVTVNTPLEGYFAEMIYLNGQYSALALPIIEESLKYEAGLQAIGSASGTGTATGVGEEVTAGSVGAASGTGTASGVGASIFSGVGAASGTGTATGVGRATFAGVGSATGIGAATGVGSATAASVGAASGVGTAAGIADDASIGVATGTGTATGIGVATGAGVGAASGIGTATGVGQGTTSAIGSSVGSGTATGVGSSVAAGVGSASGTGTALAVGENASSFTETVGVGAGIGLALGVGSFSRRRFSTRTTDSSRISDDRRPAQSDRTRSNVGTRRRSWSA